MDVVAEPDATPLVRIIAATLRTSLRNPALASKAAKLHGIFALKSAKDPQAVTMRFEKGLVALTRGVARDAQVIVTVDLDNMTGPEAAKPKLQGAMRHPFFALGVSKLLDPPPQTWQQQAQEFWSYTTERTPMPAALRVVNIDDGSEMTLGTGAGYEIHGSVAALASVFTGNSVFGQDLLEGRIYAVGTLQDASLLTGASLVFMMRDES